MRAMLTQIVTYIKIVLLSKAAVKSQKAKAKIPARLKKSKF
jgi:hypothetical protein